MTLKSFYENSEEFNKCLTLSNLDDIFYHIKNKGISVVEVESGEMFQIVRWYLANNRGANNSEIIREGRLDKFFGVSLIEI